MKALKTGLVVLVTIIVAGAIFFAAIQKKKGASDNMNEGSIKPDMSYRIEGAYSLFKYVQVNITRAGKGAIAYKLYDAPKGSPENNEKVIAVNIDPTIIQGIESLYNQLDFFNLQVKDLNKDKITVADVGTTAIYFSKDNREKMLKYGYVKDNKILDELTRKYWSLAEQYLPKPSQQQPQ